MCKIYKKSSKRTIRKCAVWNNNLQKCYPHQAKFTQENDPKQQFGRMICKSETTVCKNYTQMFRTDIRQGFCPEQQQPFKMLSTRIICKDVIKGKNL